MKLLADSSCTKDGPRASHYFRSSFGKSNLPCLCFAELTKRPVDGFSAGLVDDSNLFEWQITIMGPPDTL